MLLGADGNQYKCYSIHRYSLPPPKNPSGGGFTIDRITLQWYYDQWKMRQCIWTKPNTYKDLCRYIRTTITAYRHPTTDFIIKYDRQPPFLIDKWTFTQHHPYMLLQQKHIRILPSLNTNPRGKSKIKFTIRPPKQMISKWFFTKDFSNADLFQITAAAMSLSYPRLGCCNENRTLTVRFLNPGFWLNSNWGATKSGNDYYKPYDGIKKETIFKAKIGNTVRSITPGLEIEKATTGGSAKYYASINYDTGYFNPIVMQASEVVQDQTTRQPLPVSYGRYNPVEDDGKGNEIYLVSIHTNHWDKPHEDDLLFEGYPLWLAFWGYWSYLQVKKKETFFGIHMFVVKSKYIYKGSTVPTQEYMPLIDAEFCQGKNSYDDFVSITEKSLWYPNCYRQIKTINNICKCGPYVPKYENDRLSTWELPIRYNAVFKWGGPHMSDNIVENPQAQPTYNVPDHLQQTVQISDPQHLATETLFHSWDYRRGYITPNALKRVQQNLSTSTSLSSDSETETPKKKKRVQTAPHLPEEKSKKIQRCLQALCKQSSCQEEETTDLRELINQQKQQQQHLKHNLLTLIQDMKHKQLSLQLQTGLFE